MWDGENYVSVGRRLHLLHAAIEGEDEYNLPTVALCGTVTFRDPELTAIVPRCKDCASRAQEMGFE